MSSKNNIDIYNKLFSGMGIVLLSIAAWIGVNVAHLPVIEQKLNDFITATDKTLTDHETRLRILE